MTRIQLITAVALVTALGMTATVTGCKESSQSEQPAQKSEKAVQYTCPMHPDVVQDKPGKCPKCGMDLVGMRAAAEVHTRAGCRALRSRFNSSRRRRSLGFS